MLRVPFLHIALLLAFAFAPAAGALDRVPPPRHDLSIPGLEEPVEIVYDSWGIPHLRARTERDVWVALGFAQARDRFFQMDVTRRTIKGTKAELLGPGAVSADHDMRKLGRRPDVGGARA